MWQGVGCNGGRAIGLNFAFGLALNFGCWASMRVATPFLEDGTRFLDDGTGFLEAGTGLLERGTGFLEGNLGFLDERRLFPDLRPRFLGLAHLAPGEESPGPGTVLLRSALTGETPSPIPHHSRGES